MSERIEVLRMSVPKNRVPKVTKVNILAYLLSCFCSIAFLVFLNATQSFVITVLLRIRDNIGDYVGTLGFTDELVSMVMCPLWGTLSDKIGTRTVCSVAYIFVGFGLILFVQAKNVYPELFILRMCFAVGGSGTAAMVTALLSEVSSYRFKSQTEDMPDQTEVENGPQAGTSDWFDDQRTTTLTNAEIPVRNGTLSGLVGLCTGLGAVMAVTVFLPLPTRLERSYDLTPEGSLKGAFYLVGSFALVVGCLLFFGLRQDPARSLTKWIRSIRYKRRHQRINRARGSRAEGDEEDTEYEGIVDEANEFGSEYLEEKNSYFRLLLKGFTAASEADIFLAYVGGLIARAASVAVSLFIPLYVNQYFYSKGICDVSSNVRESCRDAYILSSILTGVAETCALVAAPVWGLACDKLGKTKSLAATAAIGVFGFIGFATLQDPRAGVSYLWVSLIGISQIGAIVCSLSLCTERRTEYSGSIAGVYSVTGAAGILILTKLGGWTSDRSRGAPFVLMAVFNIVLFACSLWVMYVDSGLGVIRLIGKDRISARERENLNQRISYADPSGHDQDSDDEDPAI
ncbi:major facilitator superfamily domain-containing protein [Lipomyces arxii]|uniref:major facilitator superfamily domain-containing protein n=1 Tax=Lipomyces arxii TaxID=56418 RepID=UPI0034CD9216